MRPEIKEYNLDWMLYSIADLGTKALAGTPKEVGIVLDHIPSFKALPEAIYGLGKPGLTFLEICRQYLENIQTAHDKGRKRGMATFCFSPALFYAMDITPVTMELVTVMILFLLKRGPNEYSDYCCEVGFTETSCSSQRGSIGAYLAKLAEPVDLIVCDSPGVCDTNANAFAFTSAYLDIPFYQLNFPLTLVDDRTKKYHRDDFKSLIKFLEEKTGKKLDIDKLRVVMKELEKQDELTSQLEELQRLVPNPIPGIFNFLIYAGRFLFAGMPLYTRLLGDMLEVAGQNVKAGKAGLGSGKEKVRALFCYIDHYMGDLKLWNFLESHNITHLGNILSRFYPSQAGYASGRMSDTYKIDVTSLDTMIDSLAEQNARMPMVRTIRGPYDHPHMWLEDVLALYEMYSADCIIYNGTPGCRNTWGMVKLFARDTEKRGYPTHIMYADAFDERVESWTATSERLEEFFKLRRLL